MKYEELYEIIRELYHLSVKANICSPQKRRVYNAQIIEKMAEAARIICSKNNISIKEE